MKKFFPLVLMVCMMMSAAALADERVILQDEQPPVVVTEVNAANETIVAKIHDANNNVLAEIKDDGSLELTDVHFRKLTNNTIIEERLTFSYEDVMHDVHHSDVECREHDHFLKVDINNAIAAIYDEMKAYDLVMYELYDVMLNGQDAALLENGNVLEVTFELMKEQPYPLVIMYSTDGLEWQLLGYVDAGDKRFTVDLPASGTLALLENGRESVGIGQSSYVPGENTPGADGGESQNTPNFTPSVTGKPAPELMGFEGADGERYVGYFRNRASDAEISVPDKNYVVVTPYAERDYVPDIQTHEHLEWAFDNILEAADVGELYTEHDMSIVIPDHAHGTIAGLLDDALQQMGLDLTHDQLVVKDLFEVTAYGDYVEYLYDPDYYLDVTFDADLDPNQQIVIIHSKDSVHWHVHPIEEYVVDADGNVSVRMFDLGVVAFLVEAEEEVNAATAVQAPN